MKFSPVLYTVIGTFFIIIFANTSLVYGQARSNQAEELITKNLQASGGSEALMNIQSISRYGYITFYNQKDKLCYHTDIIYPVKLREQIKGKEIAYDRGTDGMSFWSWTGSRYVFTDDKNLIDYLHRTAERANREILWAKKEASNYKVITSPSWAPAYSQCIQEVKAKKVNKHTYCFDTSTGLLNSVGKGEEYRLESDWRPVGNIKLPFHLTDYKNGSVVFELQLDYAELNKTIPSTQFIKPNSPHLSCWGANRN